MGSIPDNSILVTADVTVLYPSTPSRCWIKSFERSFRQKRTEKSSTEELVQILEFVLKNNFLEFNSQFKQ